MFAVKHISLDGMESIVLGDEVFYHPAGNSDSHETVSVHGPGPRTATFHGGTVFVMNETGKTITRYDLGASMVPLRAGEIRVGNQPVTVSDTMPEGRPIRPLYEYQTNTGPLSAGTLSTGMSNPHR